MSERCEYRGAFDPVTEEPLGPACGQEATQIIRWRDGRFSPACRKHGIKALTPDASALVLRIERLNRRGRGAPCAS